MVISITIILVVLITRISTIVEDYMRYCEVNKIKMFADPRYEERIRRLEKLLGQEEEKK